MCNRTNGMFELANVKSEILLGPTLFVRLTNELADVVTIVKYNNKLMIQKYTDL